MILDSNIVILAAKPEHKEMLEQFRGKSFAISVNSRVEVRGCHKLTDRDRSFFEAFFAVLEILPITDGVLDRAIALRQARKMSLGDAIIAATALVSPICSPPIRLPRFDVGYSTAALSLS